MTTKKPETEEELGEVYSSSGEFIYTNRGLFPTAYLQKAEGGKAEPQRLKEEKIYTQRGLVPHPFSVSGLLILMRNSPYFKSCTYRIANDVAGKKPRAELRADMKDNEEELKKVHNFIASKNEDGDTVRKVIEKSVIDWGSIGWWAIEVSRNKAGELAGDDWHGLYHVPAQTVRVHESKEKYAQTRDSKIIWFKRFGSEANISAKTGDEVKGKKNPANEMIFYRNYYQESDYYGAPNILPAVGAARGLIGIRDYNLSFFENYGVPAALVTLKGKWKKGAIKKITDFLDVEIRGTNNAHKTLVFKVPGTDVEIDWKPLGVDVKEGSFSLYKKDLREDMLVVYYMPPYRLGITEQGSLGGSTARESTRVYIDSVVEPLQEDVEDMLSNLILRDTMGIQSYKIKFSDIDIRDLENEVKQAQVLFSIGALTSNQVRERFDLGDKYPQGDQYFVASNYMPAGEESIERMLRANDAEMAEIKRKIDEALEGLKKED